MGLKDPKVLLHQLPRLAQMVQTVQKGHLVRMALLFPLRPLHRSAQTALMDR